MRESVGITCRYCKNHMLTKDYKAHFTQNHLAEEAKYNFIGINKIICNVCHTKMLEFRKSDHIEYCHEANFSLVKEQPKKLKQSKDKGDNALKMNSTFSNKKIKKNQDLKKIYHYCPICKIALHLNTDNPLLNTWIKVFDQHFYKKHQGTYLYPNRHKISSFIKGTTAKKKRKSSSVWTLSGGRCSPR